MKEEIVELKRWIERSGYLLENEIRDYLNSILPNSGAQEKSIIREFPFLVGLGGEQIIRTVDFKVEFHYPLRTILHREWRASRYERLKIVFLIECKSSKDDYWCFIKHDETLSTGCYFPFLIPKLLKDEWGEENDKFRIDLKEAALCPPKIPRAVSGRRLSQKEEINRISVATNQAQLFDGIHYFLQEQYKKLGEIISPEGEYTRFALILEIGRAHV